MAGRKQRLRIVVIGGGTGTFTVLSGLKKYLVELSAIVAMSDNGSSSGILRDELGVLPPGDIRQCLVALAEAPEYLRKLMMYRFPSGHFRGHSFGNLFLSALEKTAGSFDRAVELASALLRVRGKVIPVTLNTVHLTAHFTDGRRVKGEVAVGKNSLDHLRRLKLSPPARPNPAALEAIRRANAIVIAPGNLYRSTVPNFLVKGIPEALSHTHVPLIYVCNLMNRHRETDKFTPAKYVAEIEKYAHRRIDCVIVNTQSPPRSLLARYARAGEYFVTSGSHDSRFYYAKLLSRQTVRKISGDRGKRSLVRHDPDRLAKVIIKLANEKRLKD